MTSAALFGVLIGAALVAFARRIVGHGVTAAHEAGHAVVAVLLGRELKSVKVNLDQSGVTWTSGAGSRLGMGILAMAGYPAPLVVGLGVAWAMRHGRTREALVGALVAVVLSVPFWKGIWTVVVGVVLAVALGVAVRYEGHLTEAMAGGIVAIGTLGGLVDIFEIAGGEVRRNDSSDVGKVAALFFLPVIVAKAGLALFGLALAGLTAFVALRPG
jgi:hypothetical protein